MKNSNSWDRHTPADAKVATTEQQSDSPLAGLATPRADGELVPFASVVPGEVISITDAAVPAQAREAESVPRTDRVPQVEVSPSGTIQFREETPQGREVLSEVTTDTFYSQSVDLNAIADAVRRAQAGEGEPTDQKERIFVNRDGGLQMGSGPGGDRVAEVTTDTFYATYQETANAARLEREAAFARTGMPGNTVRASDGNFDGWHYMITNEFGDSYSLFLHYNPSFGVYRVALIDPRMEGTADAHGTHLWPDGILCLTTRTGNGYPDMGETFAKAALWTRGASCYRRGYGFQFNAGQD
jgi:hypothetical protein